MNAFKAPLINLRDRFLFAESPACMARWPVRSRSVPVADRPFFVVGFPRTGSTLLRAILSLHADVFIPPENGGLGKMIATFGRHRRSPWQAVVAAVVNEFQQGYEFTYWEIDPELVSRDAERMPPEERSLAGLIDLFTRHYGSAHAPGKSRWGDKSMPGDCSSLYKIGLVFPHADYIHIVRDGRDCIASAMQHGMFRRDVAEAACYWKNCILQWRRFVKHFQSRVCCHVLHYEKLVSDPAGEITSLCRFLGLQASEEMLSFQGAAGMHDVNAIVHHENVRKPISSTSIGRWKNQLGESDLQTINKIIGREMLSLGYE